MKSRIEKAGVEGILRWMLGSQRMITEIMEMITKGREIDKFMLTVAEDDSQGYSLMGYAIFTWYSQEGGKKIEFSEAAVRMGCHLLYLQAFYDYSKGMAAFLL